jgi:hypothetical protein
MFTANIAGSASSQIRSDNPARDMNLNSAVVDVADDVNANDNNRYLLHFLNLAKSFISQVQTQIFAHVYLAQSG